MRRGIYRRWQINLHIYRARQRLQRRRQSETRQIDTQTARADLFRQIIHAPQRDAGGNIITDKQKAFLQRDIFIFARQFIAPEQRQRPQLIIITQADNRRRLSLGMLLFQISDEAL